MPGFTRLPALWIGFLTLVVTGQTTPPSTYCTPPESTRLLLRSRPETEKDGKPRPFEDIRAERQLRLRELTAAHPDDFFILREYLSIHKIGQAPPEIIAEFQKRAESAPADIAAQFLYAESLVGKTTPEAIKLFDAIVQKDAAFPWTYYALTRIYGSPAFHDNSKAKANAEAFVTRCPDTTEAASLALQLDKSDQLAAFTKRLRTRIAGKAEPETVTAYMSLWRLEFKQTPPADQAPLRETVKQDIAYLESLNKSEFKGLEYLLREGYKLSGDKEGEKRLASAGRHGPGGQESAFFEASSQWYQKNPPLASGDEAKRADHRRKRLEFLGEWAAKLPDLMLIRLERLRLLGEIEETPNGQLLAEGDELLTVARKNEPNSAQLGLGAIPTVASVWAKRGIALDRIPGLVEEGRKAQEAFENRVFRGTRSDLYPMDQEASERAARFHQNSQAWETLTLAYTKLSRPADARKALTEWDTALEESRKRIAEIRAKRAKEPAPAPPAAQVTREPGARISAGGADRTRMFEDQLLSQQGWEEARYYAALAEFASSEKRPLDALAMYQSALRSMAGSRFASSDLQKTAHGKRAAEVWKQLGGTSEGWQLWLASLKPLDTQTGSPSGPSAGRDQWVAAVRPLPELKVSDLANRTWTIANFKGKTTLLNVWATWCGPCREELPHLQKLHDEVKDREDIQVITLNVDENTGVVEPFLKDNNFSFPVLFAKDFVDGFTGQIGIPTNWIADRDARIRWEALGFSGDGDAWRKSALTQLEKVRSAAAFAP